ncbi:MAG: YjhX family toxin [Hyphomicrobiales bacterium]|nr:YjhX family toxin [Hyphomicrobiales bacterium]
MNISKIEQRVLHVLALGGRIRHHRDGRRIVAVDCVDREGARLADCDLTTFARLKRRGLVRSRGGGPYELTELGRRSVRAEFDQR